VLTMSSLKVIQVCDHQGPLPDGKTLGKDEEDESSSSSQTRRGLIKIYDIQKRLQLLLCSVCTDGKRYSTIENGNNKERERGSYHHENCLLLPRSSSLDDTSSSFRSGEEARESTIAIEILLFSVGSRDAAGLDLASKVPFLALPCRH